MFQSPQEFAAQFDQYEKAKQKLKLSPNYSGELPYLKPILHLLEKDTSQRPTILAISETDSVSSVAKLQFLKSQLWSENGFYF